MKCPFCGADLAGFVIRCPLCDKRVLGVITEDPWYERLARKCVFAIRHFWSYGKGGENGAIWDIWHILFFLVISVIFIFGDPFSLEKGLYELLIHKVHILRKEPRLLYYLEVYLNTIIFKTISVLVLLGICAARKMSFSAALLPKGKLKSLWDNFLPVYLLIGVIICVINSYNPLVPNIPFNSIFPGARMTGNIVIMISALFFAPLVEEILFRGFLFPAINRYTGLYPSIILTSLAFTMAHFPQIKNDPVFMINIFVLSVMITYKRARSGSVIIAVILHFLYNFMCTGMGLMEYFLSRF